ncbi:MAG: MbnP family protein, partial [Bacteroidia bacterium]
RFHKPFFFVNLNMFKIKTFITLSLTTLLFLSCKKDQKIEPVVDPKTETPVSANSKTNAVFNFSALADNLPLIPNSTWYVNTNGDNYTVTRFNYYISNIKVKRDDDSVFSEVESYHVIKHLEGARSFTVSGLPEGSYNQIEFTIGVDSIRNVSGAQTGDLCPDSLMFWGWSTGYIFFKLEGQFQTLNSASGAPYAMHVGGYSGKDNCLRTCTFNLSTKLSLQKNKQSKVFYDVNINKIFNNTSVIDLNSYYVIASGTQGKALADNYKDMFTINHVEN